MENLTNSNNMPPVLVLDLSATGVAVARMLAGHGVEVYGAEAREDTIGNYSKHIKEPSFGFKFKPNDEFLKDLIDFSRMFNSLPVLIPADDLYIEFIGKHFEVLKDYFIMQGSLSPDISPLFLNKKEFYTLCDKFNVPYPKTIYATGGETIKDITDHLRFPIILKPNLIHKWKKYLKGQKVMLIESVDKLKNVLNSHKAILEDSMLQEVIPGGEDQIYLFKGYFNEDGKLVSSFTGRKIRQYPPNFGSASLAESIRHDEVERISVTFLEAFKFQGLCGSEFKYDERDNEYKMIEINIRPQLWEDLTRLAEKEIMWTAYNDLAGLGIPDQHKQKNGVKWVYATRDIFSAFWQFRNNGLNLSEWMKSYKGIKGDALADFRDFKMLVHLPFYVLSQVYKYKVSHLLHR